MQNKSLQNLLKNILIFLVIFLLINYLFNLFTGGNKSQDQLQKNDYGFVTDKNEFNLHDLVSATISNNTKESITIKNNCPSEPLKTFYYKNSTWEQKTIQAKITCNNTADTEIKAGEKHKFQFDSWNNALFDELGNYKLSVDINGKTIESNQFEITPISLISWVWQVFLFQPIYNTLIFVVSNLPGYDLGFAIIILTIIIRSLLLIPSQKALKAQRKLQEVQPLLSELKEKHGKDQQRLAQETMALYKEYKVNPFGSCLPLIIQLPILIALFQVVQTGLNPDNTYLLYGSLKNFDLNKINIIFFGILDLTKINVIILPLVVGILQFIQMKLSFIKQVKTDKKPKSEMEAVNKSMQYMMPVMVAVFTASVPAGVGLYWCFSTLFGIGQQFIVNKQSKQNETTIQVVDSPPKKEPEDKNPNKITKIKI